MNRDHSIQRHRENRCPWDIAIIGGGATGMGIAVDAAARGYSVCLFEQSDFGKSTSSRSTKLVHGGVRYLKQGNLSLVREALLERERLLQNAPHLVRDLSFIIPCYGLFETAFYGTGLKAYDLLAGRSNFGKSQLLSRSETLDKLPTVNQQNLRGGVLYHDGQFDDARLLIHLAHTATMLGAVLLNYARVDSISHDTQGNAFGLLAADQETGEKFSVQAKCIINATGAFTDEIRKQDQPATSPMVVPSQGTHIVLPRRFLTGDHAIMIPKTPDGRVLFAIPWREHVVVGTTDCPIKEASLEPVPTENEIDFILETASRYLQEKPSRDDILSIYAGVRPLVNQKSARSTAQLSRDHVIEVSRSGMITIVGGKWTTYRRMAEKCIDQAIESKSLTHAPCRTMNLRIHGASDVCLKELLAEPGLADKLHPDLPYCKADVIHAIRNEMARTLDDLLARRTRMLHLNASLAIQLSSSLAEMLRAELGKSENWRDQQIDSFLAIARNYMPRQK